MSARMGDAGILAAVLLMCAGMAHADGDAKRGERIFEECRACHAAERGVEGLVGPDLHGVFGRRAGTQGDFRYSPAMRRSGITWTPQSLETYIADPQAMVPANRMPYAGLPDAGARADLIQYLQQVFK